MSAHLEASPVIEEIEKRRIAPVRDLIEVEPQEGDEASLSEQKTIVEPQNVKEEAEENKERSQLPLMEKEDPEQDSEENEESTLLDESKDNEEMLLSNKKPQTTSEASQKHIKPPNYFASGKLNAEDYDVMIQPLVNKIYKRKVLYDDDKQEKKAAFKVPSVATNEENKDEYAAFFAMERHDRFFLLEELKKFKNLSFAEKQERAIWDSMSHSDLAKILRASPLPSEKQPEEQGESNLDVAEEAVNTASQTSPDAEINGSIDDDKNREDLLDQELPVPPSGPQKDTDLPQTDPSQADPSQADPSQADPSQAQLFQPKINRAPHSSRHGFASSHNLKKSSRTVEGSSNIITSSSRHPGNASSHNYESNRDVLDNSPASMNHQVKYDTYSIRKQMAIEEERNNAATQDVKERTKPVNTAQQNANGAPNDVTEVPKGVKKPVEPLNTPQQPVKVDNAAESNPKQLPTTDPTEDGVKDSGSGSPGEESFLKKHGPLLGGVGFVLVLLLLAIVYKLKRKSPKKEALLPSEELEETQEQTYV